MESVRLKDWNSSLGVVAFVMLISWFSIYAFLNPDFLAEDGRVMVKLLPYVGPLLAIWSVYKQVWYLEIGEKISFQRSFGKTSYDWKDLKYVSFDLLRKRIFFFPIVHEYLVFDLKGGKGLDSHAFRVTPKNKEVILRLIEQHAPTTRVS